jgi:hypothetical protein
MPPITELSDVVYQRWSLSQSAVMPCMSGELSDFSCDVQEEEAPGASS